MDADLTATPTVENGQVVSWQLCYKPPATTTATATQCGDGKSSSPYPKLDFAKGTGDHNIKIDIANGNGITFAQTNPLWIQPDTKPTSPIVQPTSQISQINGAGTTSLSFHDKNSDAMLLKYQLNFAGGNGLMAIDPDIQNGGKGMPWYQNSISLVIAGVVAIAVVLLLWRRRMSAERPSGTGTA